MNKNIEMMEPRKADSHFVSIVIPTLGRDTLSLTKQALYHQSRKPDEVIVILDSDRKGPAWGRNQGIAQAKGDLIAFTDDDCIPPSNWLKNLIDTLDCHLADGVGGAYKEIDPLLDDIRKRRRISQQGCGDGELVYLGGNTMFTRTILDDVYHQYGYYYDEKMHISEDREFSWRIQDMGAKLVYVPLEILHLRRMTPLGFLKFQFGRGKAIANLYHLNKKRKLGNRHKSLLWNNEEGTRHKPNWIKILFVKLAGPFDVESFKTPWNFFFFWLGEKFQGLGFLWGVSHERFKKKRRFSK